MTAAAMKTEDDELVDLLSLAVSLSFSRIPNRFLGRADLLGFQDSASFLIGFPGNSAKIGAVLLVWGSRPRLACLAPTVR